MQGLIISSSMADSRASLCLAIIAQFGICQLLTTKKPTVVNIIAHVNTSIFAPQFSILEFQAHFLFLFCEYYKLYKQKM